MIASQHVTTHHSRAMLRNQAHHCRMVASTLRQARAPGWGVAEHQSGLQLVSSASGAGPAARAMATDAPSPTPSPFLASVQPWGLAKQALAYSFALPIWAVSAAALPLQLLPSQRAQQRQQAEAQLPQEYAGWQHEMLNVNGIRLHAVSPGRRRDKPLMLMLHGFPEFWYSWRHQMKEFAKDGAYDVVALDMRGYGDSDKPPGMDAYRMDHLVADVAGAVQALGHERCILVAHDWGGAIAWLVAAMRPQLVERAVIAAGPHLGLYLRCADRKQYAASWYMLLFQAPWLPEAALGGLDGKAQAIAKMFSDVKSGGPINIAHISPVDAQLFAQAFAKPGVAKAAFDYYRAMFNTITGRNSTPELWQALKARIDVPVLVLWADSDTALQASVIQDVAQVAPAAQLVVLPNCSHWVQQDQPEKVNQLMRDFLAQPAAKA